MTRRPSSGYVSRGRYGSMKPSFLLSQKVQAMASPVTHRTGEWRRAVVRYQAAGCGGLRPDRAGVRLPSLPAGRRCYRDHRREEQETLSGSDQENLMEVTGRSAESLEILAR